MAKKTQCDISHENIDFLEEVDNIREEESQKNQKVLNEGEEFDNALKERFALGSNLNESEINKIFNEVYGTTPKGLRERIKLAVKINALMNANESLKLYMNGYIAFKAGKDVKLGVVVKQKIGNKIVQKRMMKLSNLSLGTLKTLYNEALKPSRFANKRGLGLMNFDGILSHVITSQEKGLREPSGAYWIAHRAVEGYPTNISARISQFSSESFADEAHGMNHIYAAINALKRHSDNPSLELGEKYVNFFSRFMMGQIFQNKKGDPRFVEGIAEGTWMVYDKYEAREYPAGHEKAGQLMRYSETNDVMFSFQDPVILKSYIPDNMRKGFDKKGNIIPINDKAKGYWNVPMDATILKEFTKLTEEAREIDNRVFEYMKEKMQHALFGNPKNKKDIGLMGELEASFKGHKFIVTQDMIKEIFFRPNTDLSKDIIKKLTPGQKEMYDKLFDIFGEKINDEFVIPTGHKILYPGDPEYRTQHWPVLYDRNIYKDMLRNMVKEMGLAIKKVERVIGLGQDTQGEPLTAETLRELKTRRFELISKINNAENILSNMVGYVDDNLSGNIVPLASDNKYFKRISNAYDIRNAKTDESVYYEYLKNVMSSIERNILSAQIIKALRVSSENNDKKFDKVVSSEVINLYKTVFNTPDVQGPFSRSFPNAFGSVESINNTLNWIPGRSKTAQQLNDTYRIIGNFLTGMYLSGLNTTLQNKVDKFRNNIYFGNDVRLSAEAAYHDPIEGPHWKRLIQMSGLTEFSDFFSRSMVNGITKVQLEQDVTDKLLVEMLKYHKRMMNGMSEGKSRKEFEAAIEEALSKSNRLLSPRDLVIISEAKDIKQERKDLKQKRRLAISNRLVSMAITRDFVFRDTLTKWPASIRILTKPAGLVLESMLAFMKEHKFTMADTERYIRSISFIIGVQRMIATGMLEGPIDALIKNPASVREAIFYGREYDRKVNFALSTQAIGRMGQGGFGKIWAKFKTWSHQKFAADHRIFKEAYISMKSEKNIENNTFDVRAVAKTFKALFQSKKYGRTTANEIATLRQFVLQQGVLTVLFDILSIGVFPALAPMRYAMYLSAGTRAIRGATSDFVSLVMMFPLLLLKGFFDDDDDEYEGYENSAVRTFNYYLRKTHFGFGAVWTFDVIQALIYALTGPSKAATNQTLNVLSPFTGGSTIIGGATRGIARHGVEKLYED